MRNDDEMYRSVLSRREEYRKKKEKRIRTIMRTVPVLACFCFTVVFGLRFWDDLAKLPHFPIQPDIVDESTIESPESTTAADTTESSFTDELNITDAVSTTVPNQNSETDMVTATEKTQTQTVTTAISDNKSDKGNEQETTEHKETQVPVTTAPVVETKPTIEFQTTSPVQTTAAVSDPITTATTKPPDIDPAPVNPPMPPTTTTEPSEAPPIVQKPSDPDDPPAYEPSAPPVQPISFDDIAIAAYAIRNNDVSSYSEQAQAVYLSMFERIRNDNFLYQASCSELISLKEDFGICLFPYAAYEDMGIGHYVTYKGKIYHVTFYYTDPYVISETDSIGDYLKKRMGRRSDKEITIQDQTFSESITDDGRIYASSFIDADHYFDIVTSAPEDELMKFLSIFSYEKIPL